MVLLFILIAILALIAIWGVISVRRYSGGAATTLPETIYARDELPEYEPFYDIGLSYAFLQRAPAFDEIVKSAPTCELIEQIPQSMHNWPPGI